MRLRSFARFVFIASVLTVSGAVGCDGDTPQPTTDTGITDAGSDAATDASSDVGVDADGEDTTVDPTDSDDDGLPDALEGSGDFDEDGIPNIEDTDSDNDGILDGDEGAGDVDDDGQPNHLDTDADGDGIPDSVEGSGDFDEDGIPNFLDIDADGDGINDVWEGESDLDDDGAPAFLDLDSDGDGWSDAEEYGHLPGADARPLDSDRDGASNFLDLDSDADGLGDEIEFGCPDSTDRLLPDSDEDGFGDLVEVAFVSTTADEGQACDPDRDITDDVDFYFELPFEGEEQEDTLDFTTAVRRADIAFNMDTTGSMRDEVRILQETLTSDLIPTLDREIADAAYAFSQFDDFPCNSHGSGSDRPFILRQRVTTDVAAAVAGVNSLQNHSGGDGPESGFESLYQLSTGIGRDVDCLSGGAVEVEPFDPATNFVPGSADGEIGGAGFREGALPIFVHFTDNESHAKDDNDYEFGASRRETYAAMRQIGARLIGVASEDAARNDLEAMAVSGETTVPACAWGDESERPAGCSAFECCTGSNQTGRDLVDGTCPLVYDVGGAGTGMVESITQGVQLLINFSSFDVLARVRTDPDADIDTSGFVSRVTAVAGVGPDSGCLPSPVIVDRDRDGELDGFNDVVAGSQLRFEIGALNNIVRPTQRPQVFVAYIDIIQRTGAVLDTQVVTVLVPPDLKPGG